MPFSPRKAMNVPLYPHQLEEHYMSISLRLPRDKETANESACYISVKKLQLGKRFVFTLIRIL